MISVFLPSHNKGGFAVEAVQSVTNQEFGDYELWILENSTDTRTRKLLGKYTDLSDPRVHYEEISLEGIIDTHWPAPYLLNQYYPRANGDIIMYLSDDDLFMPGIFGHVVNYFDANPGHDALYFHMARTTARKPGHGKYWEERWAGVEANVPRTAGQLDCLIDGGQAAYRKSVLDAIGQPYFYDGKNTDQAHHCDGLHLEKVAQAGYTFYPLLVKGVVHRHTPDSLWTKV